MKKLMYGVKWDMVAGKKKGVINRKNTASVMAEGTPAEGDLGICTEFLTVNGH